MSRNIGETCCIPGVLIAVFWVNEMAQRFQGYQLAVTCNRNRSGGKHTLFDRLTKDGKGARKACVLISEVGDEDGGAVQDEFLELSDLCGL